MHRRRGLKGKMMKRLGKFVLAAAAPAMMLAGCNASGGSADADGDGTISEEEMAGATEGLTKLQPGEYKITTELVSAEGPDATPEQIEKARAEMAMASRMTPPRCISEDDGDDGILTIAKQMQQGNCETTKMVSSSDTFDAEMFCKDASGEATLAMEGETKKTSSTMTVRIQQKSSAQDAEMNGAVMRVSMERTGDCGAASGGAAKKAG